MPNFGDVGSDAAAAARPGISTEDRQTLPQGLVKTFPPSRASLRSAGPFAWRYFCGNARQPSVMHCAEVVGRR